MGMRFSIVPVLALALVAVSCARARYEEPKAAAPVGDQQYTNPYHMPFTSPGTKFAGLPPAVQNTVRAQAGAAEILNVAKLTNDTHIAYKVLFQKNEVYPTMYVAPDGSILNPDFTVAMSAPADSSVFSSFVAGISLTDLPPAVVKVIQARAPTSEVDYIDKEMRGDEAVYVVSFKEKAKYPRLYIGTDGTILKQTAH